MIRSLFVFIFFVTTTSLFAQSGEIFYTDEGAIRGYDVVAFFSEQKPVKGNAEFSHLWNGATWYFSSAMNLSEFKAEPIKYVPQFGGFCAFGTAEGHKAPTQPDTWTILDGKLYFNYNTDVQKLWTKNRDQYIKQGNENWPTVKTQE